MYDIYVQIMKNLVWIVIFSLFSLLPALITIKTFALRGNNVENTEQDTSLYTERGPIFDRRGNILAMQVNSWNVGLRLIDTENTEEVLQTLSRILDIPYQELDQKLSDPYKYVQVKKHISKEEYEKILTLKKENKLVGVQFKEKAWRKYPGNESLAHLIGYFGEEGRGLDGIESSFDKELRSTGSKTLGNSIYLTIDSILQSSIEEIVYETLKESKSSFITTILMDGKTGEILAYVSLPSFDLNRYYTYTQDRLSNRIIRYNYEPGSVFKVFSLASLLDTGNIHVNSRFDASSPYVNTRYGFTIQDIWYPGVITSSEIIKFSSNVGISRAMEHIDAPRLYQYLRAFGFGEKTNIQLPGESSGVFKDPSTWSARSKPTIALGQEISVTAMQLVSAATVFANKGNLLEPQLIKKIVSPEGKIIYKSSAEKKRKVLKPETATQILEMMNLTTTPGGTAHRLRTEGIQISAKTGTAQVFDRENNEYSKDTFIASTLSIIPSDNPRLIIYSAIHDPKSGEIYGGRTTAPMIRKMLNSILPYLGFLEHPKKDTENGEAYTRAQKSAVKLHIPELYESYLGLSKREVWPLFINTDVKLQLEGNGTVVRQSPEPGSRVKENTLLTLYLE